MNSQKPQNLSADPKEKGQSMDDILAQIRRIVSDEASGAAPGAAATPPAASASPAAQRAPDPAFARTQAQTVPPAPSHEGIAPGNTEPEAERPSLRDRLGFGDRTSAAPPASATPAPAVEPVLTPPAPSLTPTPLAEAASTAQPPRPAETSPTAPQPSVFGRTSLPRPTPEGASEALTPRSSFPPAAVAESAPQPSEPNMDLNAGRTAFAAPDPFVEDEPSDEQTSELAPELATGVTEEKSSASVEPASADDTDLPTAASAPSPLERLKSSMAAGRATAGADSVAKPLQTSAGLAAAAAGRAAANGFETSPSEAVVEETAPHSPSAAVRDGATPPPAAEASTPSPEPVVAATAQQRTATLEGLVADAIGAQVKAWMDANMERVVREVVAEDLADRKLRESDR